MPIQLECPGCKATLLVADELAGKQGKCSHCGHRLIVPGKPSFGGLSSGLSEATPEAMVRELHRRQQSALLLIFQPAADGSYDLANVPDADLKCIATEDINQARFAQVVAGFTKRFGPRKKGPPATAAPNPNDQLYELKGDRLGMSLDEFRGKYNRSGEGGQRLPLCSDTTWGANKASLRTEPWHQGAKIIHARVDLPTEDNSPTVAGVKTELLLYQFVDGKLFRIAAFLPTDQFHVISEAAIKKYGPVTREIQRPRQLIWENPQASVVLTRGSVHPREPSILELVHKQLDELAASRAPTAAADI
jgi:DNA-directed RNA polymerase subunit RPC12/RpoP